MKQNNCQEKNIIIIRRWGAKMMRMHVGKQGKIILTMPVFCPKSQALSFLEKHRDWVMEQEKKYQNRLVFNDGMTVCILGQEVQIHHVPTWKQGVCVEGKTLTVGGEKEFIDRRVRDFVRKQTALYIDEKAREMAAKIGKKINRISLKDTTSRWGSCSGKHNLNFCWRLGLAPTFVLDYIVAHEVAHLQEMNHSLKFWRVVAELCSCRSDAEIWLRRNGHTLR